MGSASDSTSNGFRSLSALAVFAHESVIQKVLKPSASESPSCAVSGNRQELELHNQARCKMRRPEHSCRGVVLRGRTCGMKRCHVELGNTPCVTYALTCAAPCKAAKGLILQNDILAATQLDLRLKADARRPEVISYHTWAVSSF